MSAELASHVMDVPAQYAEVRATNSLDQYKRFVGRHFQDSPDGPWLTRVSEDIKILPEIEENPDFFRFLGLVGIVCAQYGFELLTGQLNRHSDKKWALTPVHPRHQLAVASYTAGLNLKAYSIRRDLIDDLPSHDYDYGVWGIFFQARNGRIIENTPYNRNRYLPKAMERVKESRVICLPDETLNSRLAGLGFTGQMAEQMPDNEFETDILPEVHSITKGLLNNPTTVFPRT